MTFQLATHNLPFAKELENDILIRRHISTDVIIGFSILNFELRFAKTKKPFSVQITANFQLKKKFNSSFICKNK